MRTRPLSRRASLDVQIDLLRRFYDRLTGLTLPGATAERERIEVRLVVLRGERDRLAAEADIRRTGAP